MDIRIITSLLCALLLQACASPRPITDLDIRKNRIGQDRQQLISELGQPEWEIHTTQEGGPFTTALVYDDHPKGMDCVDAYLVETATGRVIDYYCR